MSEVVSARSTLHKLRKVHKVLVMVEKFAIWMVMLFWCHTFEIYCNLSSVATS